MLDAVDVAVPHSIAQAAGELVATLGEHLVDLERRIGVAGQGAVEVEQYCGNASEHAAEVYGEAVFVKRRRGTAQGGAAGLRQLIVDNTLLVVVWSVAAAVTMCATIAALRAGRRARRAADLVAQLLEPAVVVGESGAAAVPRASAEPVVAPEPLPLPTSRPTQEMVGDPVEDPVEFASAPVNISDDFANAPAPEPRDPGQARIPVFDLDRLRWWLGRLLCSERMGRPSSLRKLR